MYDLYREWITFCRDSARVDLFCAYSFVRRIEFTILVHGVQ